MSSIQSESWLCNSCINDKAIAIVSVFDKTKYGIARYVQEETDCFKKEGWEVLQAGLTPEEDSDVSFDLRSLKGLWKWIQFCGRKRPHAISYHFYEGLTFQWIKGPAILRWIGRFMQAYALCRIARCSPSSRLVLHELSFGPATPLSRRYMTGYVLSRFGKIEVFTEILKDRLVKNYPFIKHAQIEAVAHERYIKKNCSIGKSETRRILGLSEHRTIFLCLGFLAPQKGFLEAMRQFAADPPKNADLWVVGETHDKGDPGMNYLEEIKAQAQRCGNIHVINKYVSDNEFDIWITAADYVLLPYKSSMNSGVGARSLVLGTGMIISNLPTLKCQFPSAFCFNDYPDLGRLFNQLAQNEKEL